MKTSSRRRVPGVVSKRHRRPHLPAELFVLVVYPTGAFTDHACPTGVFSTFSYAFQAAKDLFQKDHVEWNRCEIWRQFTNTRMTKKSRVAQVWCFDDTGQPKKKAFALQF